MNHADRTRGTATARRFFVTLLISAAVVVFAVAPAAFAQWAGSSTPGYIYTASGVGIGTSTPSASYSVDIASTTGSRVFTNSPTGFGGVTVQNDTGAVGTLLTLGSGRADTYAGVAAANYSVFITAGASSNGFIIETFTAKPLIFGTNNAERLRLDASGNATVTGNLTATGNLAAKYQDVAEWVPSERELDPATVVVLSTEDTNHVVPSRTAYDTKVAGVVSSSPGLILGEGSKEKSKVATSGRVKVKVDATHHAVGIGDLLVTSDDPGYAMYSEPVEIAGVRMHRPGTIIGKALEPLAGGKGEILVLLTLQ